MEDIITVDATNIELSKEQLISLESIINIDKIENNSVLLFRIKELSPNVYAAMKKLVDLYGEKLQSKGCDFLILKDDTKIEEIKEGTMNSFGWIKKKEKSLIIH